MDLEHKIINLLVTEERALDIINIVSLIQQTHSEFQIGIPRVGKLSNKIILSYRVNRSQFEDIVRLFTKYNIDIFTKDPKIIQITKEPIKRPEVQTAALDPIYEMIRVKKPLLSKSKLEEFVKNGKYIELIKISKDSLSYETKFIEMAVQLIPKAVQNLVETAYNDGLTNQANVNAAINTLIDVASDKELMALQKLEFMKLAGMNVIDLCEKNPAHLDRLLEVCNHAGMPRIVNIKATAKFSEIVFKDEGRYYGSLSNAVKMLNVKWLEISYEEIKYDLNAKEDKAYKNLIEYVNTMRKIKGNK